MFFSSTLIVDCHPVIYLYKAVRRYNSKGAHIKISSASTSYMLYEVTSHKYLLPVEYIYII